MIQALLFDYYGVIGKDPLLEWSKRHALNPWQLRQVKQVCDQSDSGALSLGSFFEQLGLIVKLSGHEVQQQLDGGLGLNGSLIQLIRDVRQKGTKTGIVSNTGSGLRNTLKRYNIADNFDVVVISAELGIVKPEPRIYDVAAKELQLPINDILFFDDHQKNIDGAREAGMQAELFISTEDCCAALRKYQIIV